MNQYRSLLQNAPVQFTQLGLLSLLHQHVCFARALLYLHNFALHQQLQDTLVDYTLSNTDQNCVGCKTVQFSCFFAL